MSWWLNCHISNGHIVSYTIQCIHKYYNICNGITDKPHDATYGYIITYMNPEDSNLGPVSI